MNKPKKPKKKIFALILTISLLFLIALTNARTLEMPLLAVHGENNNFTGSIAKLSLTIEEGSGRVFLDTSPVSKTDTQISARTAQRQACNFLNIDCSQYDFFYQIKADSSIIGGPSAGAAFTVITIAGLDNQEIKKGISITGTINSGNIVGPVGGLKEKIKVASQNNINKVLIAQGEGMQEEDNSTFDLIDYGKNFNVEVIEIAIIRDALEIFTEKSYPKIETNFTISPDYENTMHLLANDLCNRGEYIFEEIIEQTKNFTELDNNTKIIEAKNLTSRSKEAYEQNAIYTAASYCYGANVQYRSYLLEIKNLSVEEFTNMTNNLGQEITEFNNLNEEEEISTITDIQTKMIVKERILEAENIIKQIKDFLELDLTVADIENSINFTNISNKTRISQEINKTIINQTINETEKSEIKLILPTERLAHAIERLYSAKSWFKFYDNSGAEFDFTQSNLEESCRLKLQEADERYQYVNLYFPNILEDALIQYNQARTYYYNEQYELCLFKAAKTVAAINYFVNLLYITDSKKINNVTNLKLKVAEELIASQAQKERFPIVGYSYFEYSRSLMQTDKFTALLYSEYALELSNLDLYFKEKKTFRPLIKTNPKETYIFLTGFCFGIVFAFLFVIIFNLRLKKLRNQRTTGIKRKRRKV
jgi:uncharacterized protein